MLVDMTICVINISLIVMIVSEIMNKITYYFLRKLSINDVAPKIREEFEIQTKS